MAKTINLIRIANARLVSANIDKFGKTFAIQSPWNADGFSSVNVMVEQAPSDIKKYLEGDNSITVYPVPSNVDKLCELALTSFPSIEDLYLFKNNGVVTIEDDLSYLENLKLIFVASDYISSYSSYTIITSDYQSFTSVDDYVGKVVDTNIINSAYTTFTSVDDYLKSYVVYNGVMTYVTNDNKNDLGIVAGTTIAYFGASAYKVTNDNKNSLYIVSGVTIAYDRYVTNIVEDYTLTIPFVGDTTLTSEYVDSVIAMLSNAEKNAITKVVIPTDFTQESADSIAWGYDFNELRNLNNNIWYGATQYDFSVWTIEDTTQDHILTASVVSASVNSIPTSKLTTLEKIIVPVDFTSYDSGSIAAIQNGLTNLRYLETTYSGGAMELDLQGDVVAKINDIGKTLDEALVYARTLPVQTIYQNDNSLVIFPPLTIPDGSYLLRNCHNLVYVYKLITGIGGWQMFASDENLVEIKDVIYNGNEYEVDNMNFEGCSSLKRVEITFTVTSFNELINRPITFTSSVLEKIILTNYASNLTISTTSLTRQAFIDLFNSLGTPTTQKTLTIGATNLAKLTADDIAIATAKNWIIQ